MALLALVVLDVVTRARSTSLEAGFLRSYRLPDVNAPPLDEFSDAVKARRLSSPGRVAIGLTGPSSVWGHWLKPADSISARLEARLRQTGFDLDVFNLAMVRNRYVDDRAFAAYFIGDLDYVLVPYAAFLFVEQCPSHPDVIAWSGRIPDPFGAASSCPPIARHKTNAVLDEAIRSAWSTYRHRNAIRRLLFPDTGDLGRAMNASFLGAFAVNSPRPRAAAPVTPPLPADIDPIPPPKDVAAEITNLCREYAAHNTRVLFYRFPEASADNPSTSGEEEESLRRIKGVEEFLSELHAIEQRCDLLDVGAWHLGPMTMFDHIHPTALGADAIAGSLADAVRGRLSPGSKSAPGSTP
ncbi:MAG TPA: hypothetical protein VGL59_18355 [Polyangia bacterium]